MITTSGAVLTAVMVLLASGNGWPRQTPAPQSLPTILVEQLRSLPPPTSIANAENARWDELLRRVKEAPAVALPALADALNGSDSAISGNAGSALWMLAVGQTAQGKNAPKLDMYPILTKLTSGAGERQRPDQGARPPLPSVRLVPEPWPRFPH